MSVEIPGGRVPRRRKQDKALSGLSRGNVGSELVDVVGGAALAPAAAANSRALMMPGGHIARMPCVRFAASAAAGHDPVRVAQGIASGCNPIVVLPNTA